MMLVVSFVTGMIIIRPTRMEGVVRALRLPVVVRAADRHPVCRRTVQRRDTICCINIRS